MYLPSTDPYISTIINLHGQNSLYILYKHSRGYRKLIRQMWPVIKPKYSAGKRALNLENRRIYQITPYTLQSSKTIVRIRFSIPENPLVQTSSLGESLYRPTGYILYDLSTSDSGLCSYLHFRVLQFQ